MIFDISKSKCTDIALLTPLAENTSMAKFKPFIEAAEKWFCSIPLGLNRQLYYWFDVQFNGTIDPEDQEKYNRAIAPMQKAIALYAYYKFFEQNNVQAADSGNVIYNNQLSSTPTDVQYKTQLYGAKRNAYDALEYLIYSILVPNASEYPDFKIEDAIKSFVNSPSRWREYHSIVPEGQLETYIELVPFIKAIESNIEEKVLGEDYYGTLLDLWREKVIDGTSLDPKESKLINKISKAVVFHAHRLASPILATRLNPFGNKKENRDREDNSTNEMNNLLDQNNKLKDDAIREVFEYLKKNEAFFTVWADSEFNITQSNNGIGGVVVNKNDNGAIAI